MSDVSQTPGRAGRWHHLGEKLKQEAREWGITLAGFVPVFLVFSGLVYELRVIPSESMVPNLQVGDRVAVNKFAYGYSRNSLPFSLGRYIPLPDGRLFANQPERGDVAVFEHPHTPRVMIKRIIGLPGDTVVVRDGLVRTINDQPVERSYKRRVRYSQRNGRFRIVAGEYEERFDDRAWQVHDIEQYNRGSTVRTFNVPKDHFLFMGDNRDNSMDGRNVSGHCRENRQGVIDRSGCPPRFGVAGQDASVGFVPFENLVGRADTVLFTTYYCARAQAVPCMKKRLWRSLGAAGSYDDRDR